MLFNKPHLEFHALDMEDGWETPEGYPSGFKQKILASDIDEDGKKGSRSRLLKVEPGTYSTEPFVHDHWEEVFLLEGDLIVGNDAEGQGGEKFVAKTYACRPPGVYHGPFKSDNGCVMFEIHYYDEAEA
ncbi:MAG: cupin domain-containing protein [Alphaproteobacteria bacterium]|nr:cupin domain-containing protein [Alphaproteobacteria bacterium]